MASRGLNLGGDVDKIVEASVEEIDAIVKKFCQTKNVKPETALRWALQRAMNETTRNKILSKLNELFETQANLL